MSSKRLLSWMLSAVSFVLIATFVIPMTFAQSPSDVSGVWIVKIVRKKECCPDPSDNGRSRMEYIVPFVTQVGDEFNVSWTEEGSGDLLEITGKVYGKSVYFTVVTTYADNPSCGWVDHVVGFVKKGNSGKWIIKGCGAGGATCSTCRVHYKITVRILK